MPISRPVEHVGQTLLSMARHRASLRHNERAYGYKTETEEVWLTHGELDRRARALAVALRRAASPGDRIALVLPPGLDVAVALLACLYSGLVGVPAFLPGPTGLRRTLPPMVARARELGVRAGITTKAVLTGLQDLACPWIAIEDLDHALEAAWLEPELSPSTDALFTDELITHGQLMERDAIFTGPVVGLSPHGSHPSLLFGVLPALRDGVPYLAISPLASPRQWLLAIASAGAAVSVAPIAVYDECVRKTTAAERAKLDLRSWKIAFHAGEDANVCRRFVQAFAASGFGAEALRPIATSRAVATKLDGQKHPLLATHFASPADPKRHFWETTLDLAKDRYLGDHRVQGSVVLPASAYVETARAAAARVFGQHVVVEDVLFKNALVIGDDARRTFHVALTLRGEIGSIQFYSRPANDDGEWMLHATANARATPCPALTVLEPLAAIRARCSAEFPRSALYRDMKTGGLEYGAAFQGVDKLWCTSGEAVASMRMPPEIAGEVAQYGAHPAFLDACFHALAAALPSGERRAAGTDLYLPTSLARLDLRQPTSAPCWVHATARAEDGTGDTIEGDVRVTDDRGMTLLAVNGLRLSRLGGRGTNPSEWLHDVTWRRVSQPRAKRERVTRWLVLTDGLGIGERLVTSLEAAGHECTCVRRGQPIPRGTWSGAVHLWGLDGEGTSSALAISKAVAARLWIVTRGAQSLGPGETPALDQAPLWGLGRAVACEHPDRWGGLIDLDPSEAGEQSARSLAAELCHADAEDQIAFRGGERHAVRLVRRLAKKRGEGIKLRTDASYLVTGGLGGLGLLVARWMVERGARRLVLIGRTILPPRSAWNSIASDTRLGGAIDAIRALEHLGATVHLPPLDVGDEEQLTAFLKQYAEEGWPAIAGVVHAAGTMLARPLDETDEACLGEVARAKATGAWNLHRALAQTPLDFFVLFSSMASLIPLPYQAAYASANAFLDALAHARQCAGLRSVSIHWGTWARVGMGSQNGLAERLGDLGIGTIEPRDGLELLEAILQEDVAEVAVMPPARPKAKTVRPLPDGGMGDSRWLTLFQRTGPLAILSDLVAIEPGDEGLRRAVEDATPETRAKLLVAHVVRQLSRALRIPAERIDPDEPLTRLGMDSLMGTELRNGLRASLGITLPIAKLLGDVTVRSLVEEILLQLERTGDVATAITATHESRYPLSYGQRAMWFMHHFAPEGGVYNEVAAFRIRSSIDVDALERAFQIIVDRHAPLRTRFEREPDGEPFQVVEPARRVTFLRRNVEGCDDDTLDARVREEAFQPFDLENGPPFRVHLFSRTETDYVLVMVAHHIVIDMTSYVVILDELQKLYPAACHRTIPALAPQGFSYGDYVQWQSTAMKGAEGERLLDYWRSQLSGELPVLDLPTDRPRGPVHTFRGSSTTPAVLGAELTDRVRELARAGNATPFMVLVAAFFVLLQRYSDQDEILIGTHMAGRSRPEWQGLVGYLANAVVLRADLAGDPTFADLLARVCKTTLGALEHQDYPFPLLVQKLAGARDPARSPVFQVQFVLQSSFGAAFQKLVSIVIGSPRLRVDLGGMTIEGYRPRQKAAKFDLQLVMVEGDGGLAYAFEYNSDLFEDATVARMMTHYRTVLDAAVSAPERRVASLPILDSRERERLISLGRGPVRDFETSACLHELIDRQVARSRDAVAVIAEEETLTYAELDARANHLAHELCARGVEPGSAVGICMYRSIEMVVALLAILKAGAAYVPLDPSHPPERIASMMAAAQCRVVIAQAICADHAATSGAQIILPHGAQTAVGCPEVRVGETDPAYIIFTSGSTGQPKGVIVSHRAIRNRLLWMQEALGIDASDAVLQKTPIGFDVSVWELFWPLMTGARLVMARPDGHKDTTYLARVIREQRITTVHFVPSMLDLFLQDSDARKTKSLKRVICSGEALHADLRDRLFRTLDAELYNLYGPTEAAVDVSSWHCRRDDASSVVPIGTPIANVDLFVLDRGLAPLPAGIPGELHIGGVGLADGYVGRPDLTAERFIANPYAPGRLYKTGDRARMREDGAIEYLGRLDDQVKIQGVRIEPGEIEVVLRTHASVREVVVLPRSLPNGRLVLEAFAVVEGGGPPPADLMGELRERMRRSLPDAMIPHRISFVETIPLSAHGKTDRRALLALAPQQHDEALREAPRTPTETAVADAWMRTLDVADVGVHDNFFSMGGDSIRSLRLRGALENAGLHVSTQEIYRHQTIAALAAAIDAGGERARQSAIALEPFSLLRPDERRETSHLEDAYPATMLQQGMLYHNELRPEVSLYHDVFSFGLRTKFDARLFEKAVTAAFARHPVLRSSFDVGSFSRPLQLVHRNIASPLTVLHLEHLSPKARDAAVDELIASERRRGVDAASPPLVRCFVQQFAEDVFQFSVSFHHAVLDGWSVASLISEVFTSYLALRENPAAMLVTTPTSSFRESVAVEQAAVASPATRTFWTTKLADFAVAELPRWTKRGAEREAPEQLRRSFVIPPEVAAAAANVARERGVSLKSVLLAAHVWVHRCLSGTDDLVTGVVTHNRPDVHDGDRILGLFVTTIPLCVDLADDTWTQLIDKVAAAEHDLIPHRAVPLAEIQRMSGASTLFEVAFNYVNFHIYDALLAAKQVEVLSEKIFERSNFALLATFLQRPPTGELTLHLDYDNDLVSSEQAVAFGGYYLETLRAIAYTPGNACGASSILSPKEYEQLAAWNQTSTPLPTDTCVHRLFEMQAERTPRAVAAIAGTTRVTYEELNRRANQLAHHLRRLGVRPGALVGVCLHRTEQILVALLGVLKAGGAYVAADPTYPKDRVAFILKDARVHAFVTEASLRDAHEGTVSSIVSLDDDADEIAGWSDHNVESGVASSDLAYVLYTSGSTGLPKGVAIEHRNTVALLDWATRAFDAAEFAGMLFSTSICFDLSIFEMFAPLCVGGTVIVADNAIQLPDIPAANEITFINTVPSAIDQLAKLDSIPPSVVTVALCGEVLRESVVRETYARSQVKRVYNFYGPTEDTTYSTGALMARNPAGPPTIGRPISNRRAYVLDRHMNHVPVGVAGELYLGGAGVARGYLNRPELTRERFVERNGERLYRTGDVAHFLP
ncbi:MAG TPA: amino acid adenylation domain-containing protein, partial [Polyangiaceae bacterium]|nr:amino acid adenylation domain-containing protein [Polyangiaceae bacterium]